MDTECQSSYESLASATPRDTSTLSFCKRSGGYAGVAVYANGDAVSASNRIPVLESFVRH
jgi:hypothetical protein